VLAVRNLCEGNHLNQAFINSLSKKGVVQSPVLQDFGITLKDSSSSGEQVEEKQQQSSSESNKNLDHAQSHE